MQKKQAKQMKLALSSSVMRELKQQYSDAPEEITVRTKWTEQVMHLNFRLSILVNAVTLFPYW